MAECLPEKFLSPFNRVSPGALSPVPVGSPIAFSGFPDDHKHNLTRARLAYERTDSQSKLAQQDWRTIRKRQGKQPARRWREEVKP